MKLPLDRGIAGLFVHIRQHAGGTMRSVPTHSFRQGGGHDLPVLAQPSVLVFHTDGPCSKHGAHDA